MRYVVIEYPEQDTGGYLDQMFRLRARVFHDNLKWKGVKLDKRGYEIDRLDRSFSPVYVLIIDDNDKVIGSQRLVLTTGPMLNDFPAFKRTLLKAARIENGQIIEISRTCVDPDLSDRKKMFILGYLLEVTGKVVIAAGAKAMLAQFEEDQKNKYEKLGCIISTLETTTRLGKKPVHAGIFPVSPTHLKPVRENVDRFRKLVMREDARRISAPSSHPDPKQISESSHITDPPPQEPAPLYKPWLTHYRSWDHYLNHG